MRLATGLHERQCGLIVTGFTSEVYFAGFTRVSEEDASTLESFKGPQACAV